MREPSLVVGIFSGLLQKAAFGLLEKNAFPFCSIASNKLGRQRFYKQYIQVGKWMYLPKKNFRCRTI
jgi:hypothetical protein